MGGVSPFLDVGGCASCVLCASVEVSYDSKLPPILLLHSVAWDGATGGRIQAIVRHTNRGSPEFTPAQAGAPVSAIWIFL